jgi:hypothetical protein
MFFASRIVGAETECCIFRKMSEFPQPNQSVVRISAALALVYSNASPETLTKSSHDCFCPDHGKRSAKI